MLLKKLSIHAKPRKVHLYDNLSLQSYHETEFAESNLDF